MNTFLIVAMIAVVVAWSLGYEAGKKQGQIETSSIDAWAHIDEVRYSPRPPF